MTGKNSRFGGRRPGDFRDELRSTGARLAALCLAAALLGGCATQSYEAAPLDAQASAQQFQQRRLDAPAPAAFLRALDVAPQAWPPARWRADDLFLAALYYQPDLAVDRGEWRARLAAQQAAAQRAPIAINPQLEHHSQADGESAWTVGALSDVVIPGPGKRAARRDAAGARAESARLQLGEAAWALRARVQRAALMLAAQQELAELAEQERDSTAQGLDVLKQRQAQGVTGALEVSSMRLRLQRARLAASQARRKAATARVELAAAVGVPVAAIDAVTLDLGTDESSLPEAPADAVQQMALVHRYDVRRALSDYALADAELRGAVADQYPDLTLSPGFLFDQADRVWVLEASWLLLLPGHNDGPIATARAERDSAAARFRSVQARAVADVAHARADYAGARDVLEVAGRIRAAQRRQFADVQQRVKVGYEDHLALVTARIETIAARRAYREAVLDAHRTRAALETAIESRLPVETGDTQVIRRFVAGGVDATADISPTRDQRP